MLAVHPVTRASREVSYSADTDHLSSRCTIIPGHEVRTIVEFAHQGNFDLLVVAFTGHSKIFDYLWGGTCQNLTGLTRCSVLVLK
jgi:nucleotide-binding universal stress UspA family protein